MIWPGRYDLTVHVDSPTGRPRTIHCEAFGRREQADAALARVSTGSGAWSTTADPFDGQPLNVRVAVSGRESLLRRELDRMQFRVLAITAVMPDGRRVAKIVEIPDGRLSREITVTLP